MTSPRQTGRRGPVIRRILIGIGVLIGAIYLFNASWRVAPPGGGVQVIAHRGVHQTFDNAGLGNDGCSAERIYPPTHELFENTLPSMTAAFAAGADIVEFDIHPTTDGRLAVFHDWTVDCRTEGTGETRSHTLATLKSLDIGYGYTADGGATFPFRGKGVGLMPEIEEVFGRFPEGRFLVNFKSNEEREADMLAALVAARPEWRRAIWGVYGGDPPSRRAAELIGDIAFWTRRSTMDCLLGYIALGWAGYLPDTCRNITQMIPLNVAPYLWGWPDLLVARFRDAGTGIILIGPYEAGDPGTSGIDTAAELREVPPSFAGYLWTNRIETIGPLARQRFPTATN